MFSLRHTVNVQYTSNMTYAADGQSYESLGSEKGLTRSLVLRYRQVKLNAELQINYFAKARSDFLLKCQKLYC